METFHEANTKILKNAMEDIQKIWDKYEIGTHGKDGPATVETNKRWEQYHNEFDELKKKYNGD